MRLQLNRILAPVTVLGYGQRIGLWVQGCGIACPGCASVDTWEPSGGESRDVDGLAAQVVREIISRRLVGVTLTGGEPTDQAPQLELLVLKVREYLSVAGYEAPVDVLLFTGRPARAAAARAAGLWKLLDAAVCGPYRRDEPGEEPLLASANQELVLLSPLAAERYSRSDDVARLQVVSEDGQLLIVGLPRTGDLDRFESLLCKRGVSMRGNSWRVTT